jgi:diguanylate cyclase (GGDEF)-like protein
MAISTPERRSTRARPVGRLTSRLLGRAGGRQPLDVRLRGGLPLRYPSDPLDPSVDPLTLLGSQRAFVAALGSAADRLGHDGLPYGLVLIDVDLLGAVNLRRGWVEGDELLRRLAGISRSLSAAGARTFRIGGDEFAVLMPGAGPEQAASHAWRMLDALERSSDDAFPAAFSAGVASVPATAAVPELAYHQAAAALADVKRNGRCAVAVFEPTRHLLRVPVDGSVADLVDQVVAERTLVPVFQPIVDLRTGQVLGYEGLVRLASEGAGQGTRELFTAADAVGRITELDLACVDVIIGSARAISADRLLTINLSPRTLAGRDFEPAWLLRSLVQAGISPARVIIELSDAEPVDDLGRLQRSFAELQRFGLRLAADDVDVDDPARRLLTHVPFDVVKIDLSRMWQGAQSGPQLAVLRDAALSRHARVVVEGVETTEQFVAVRDLEIGAGQGYLLGRPDRAIDVRVVDLGRLESEADLVIPAPAFVQSVPPETFDEDLPHGISPERLAMLMPAQRADMGVLSSAG